MIPRRARGSATREGGVVEIAADGAEPCGDALAAEQRRERAQRLPGHGPEVFTVAVVEPRVGPVEEVTPDLRVGGLVGEDPVQRARNQRRAAHVAPEPEQWDGQRLADARGPHDQLRRAAPGFGDRGWADQPLEIDVEHDPATQRRSDPGGDLDVDELVDDEVRDDRHEVDRRASGQQGRRDLGERRGGGVFAERGLRPRPPRRGGVARQRLAPRELLDPAPALS
jgi:hypothetical protein